MTYPQLTRPEKVSRGTHRSLARAALAALVLMLSLVGTAARGIPLSADVTLAPAQTTEGIEEAVIRVARSDPGWTQEDDVAADVIVPFVGVNANMMNDRRRTEWPVQSYGAALRELGAGIVRYPGGDMADSYMWSVPPFAKSDPRMARVGPEEVPCWDDPTEGNMSYTWLGCDPRQIDFPLELHPQTLGFDDFMTSASQAGSAVNLVVPLDGASEFNDDDHVRTRSVGAAELLETSVAWVTYCKDKYNVTLWEVGNQPNERLSSGDFAHWLFRYSVAMKAVNPGIKIGVSGDDPEWLDDVLNRVGAHVDWISVSASPLRDFLSYADYLASSNQAPPPFEALRQVLRKHSADRGVPLWFAVTSLSAAGDTWADADPVRRALAFSDELLRHAATPGVRFLQFSMTKWFNDNDPLSSAFAATNALTLVGEAVALVSNALSASGGVKLRATTSVPLLSAYFAIDRTKKEASVVLVNHGGRTRVKLQLNDIFTTAEGELPGKFGWEASSFALRPAKSADGALERWQRPLVQGLDVDAAIGAVHVEVPETSLVSVRITKTIRGRADELTGRTTPSVAPPRGRYLVLTDNLASPFTPYILRIQDLMRSLTAPGHEVVHFLETSDDVKCPDATRQQHLEETGALWMCGGAPRLFQLLQQREHARAGFDAVIMMPWYWFSPNLFERHVDTIAQTAPQTALVVLTDDAHGARAARLSADFQKYPHLPFSPDPDVAAREARTYARADVVVTVSEEDAQLVCAHVRTRAQCFAWTWSTNTTRARVPAAAELPGFGARRGMALMGDFHNPTTATALQWFIWNVLPALQEHFDAKNERVPLTLVGSGFRSAVFTPLLAQLEQAIKLSRGIGPLELQISPEGPEAVALLQTQRVMLAPVQAGTGVNTKAFFGLSIGLPVVSTRAALGGYFPRKATGDGGWEVVPEREFCGKRMTPDDVFFVGATADEYTRSLIEAYTNETAWTDRLEASLEVASCLMNADAQASIAQRLTAAVASARANLQTVNPTGNQPRRAMLQKAPEIKPLSTKVPPSGALECRNGMRTPRGRLSDFSPPGWFIWPAAAAAFLLRVALFVALNPAETLQRIPSPRKRLEPSASARSHLLMGAKKLWLGILFKNRWGSFKGGFSVRTFLLVGLIYTGLALIFAGGAHLTSSPVVNPFSGAVNPFSGPVDYFNPRVAAAKADALAHLVAPPVDVDCSCDGFDYFLVIGVASAAHAAAERQNARDTWARFGELVPRCPVMVRFIVGRHKNGTVMEMVAREMEEYGDIVQDLAIEESYDALSRKTAAFHRWAAENVSFKFAFKTDDDIFVRVDRLVSALYQASLRQGFHVEVRDLPRVYWGNLGFMKMPIKERSGEWAKWYSDFWPAGVPYPLFGRGHGFALSHDLVRALARWENKLDCAGLEDVCTGVHLSSDHVYEATGRQGLNVVHLMETGLPIFEDILTDYDDTQCEEGMTLALHLKRPIETMRTFVRTYETCGRMCGCGRGAKGVRNATVIASGFKLTQMRAAAAAAAWPYFDLQNQETEMYHDKYECLFTQADYHSAAERALCRAKAGRKSL
ncbi:Glycosyl transferase family 31 protein [Klebsormidium nitens]|uniref:Glycosyl transferase family 31 protein n=1 Tax=Klebsormidium nitens TaxID=105231 RepID=A0A1Y1I1Y9_KLENI|nr:Glycosyl transferase family 31 protein [Klebsormidium nitens]|eukprot:GAQ82766.1 Glycosyl transferase family 31 protein [Klebsormidium nitens]